MERFAAPPDPEKTVGPWKIAVPETTMLLSADGPLTESDPPIATSPEAARSVVWAPPLRELRPPAVKGPETESVLMERLAAPPEPE